MPELVERMQAMVAAVEQQAAASHAQLAQRQQEFHQHSSAAQAQLALALEQSLKAGVADSAQAVAGVLQPLAQSTLEGLARQASSLHQEVALASRQQLDGLASGLERAGALAAQGWTSALAAQQRGQEASVARLQQALDGFAAGFEQRSSRLVDEVAAPAVPDAVRHARVDALGAWIAWVVVLTVFVAWGTGVLGGRRLARLLNDESTIEHRRKASEAGLRGALAAAFIVYAATFYETIPARDVCRLLVTATVAPALLRFGWLELRALGRG